MKKVFGLILLLISSTMQPSFANEPTPMPEAYREWEEENKGREVAEEGRYSELWSKTLLLLIAVLLVLFVATWYLKRFGGMKMLKDANKDSRIQILEKRVLSPKAVVYLISIDGHKIALSETSSGVSVLQELTHSKEKID